MSAQPTDDAPVAVVGGRLFTDLADVTDDLTALDSTGWWVVVLTFEGRATCARFRRVRPAPRPSPAVGGRGGRAAARRQPGRAVVEPSPWASSIDRHAFGNGVAAIRMAILAGDVYQVNLCRVLTSATQPRRGPGATGAGVVALGDALASGNPAPHAATVWLPSAGLAIASASPELFLRRNGRAVASRPIKGTAAAPAGFLAKDRAENVMIVDLVRNDLGRVCEYGSIRVPALCEVESHPGLHHLVSTVEGELRSDTGWAELVDATFPPGSVVGAPKLAALRVIRELEPVPRGPYCGSIGWVDADRTQGELNVAIRTFWLADGCWHLGTGGGVTWDSTADGEWEETELKARRLLAVAGRSTVLA
jgi:para-aminobenzoate synthetase component 1